MVLPTDQPGPTATLGTIMGMAAMLHSEASGRSKRPLSPDTAAICSTMHLSTEAQGTTATLMSVHLSSKRRQLCNYPHTVNHHRCALDGVEYVRRGQQHGQLDSGQECFNEIATANGIASPAAKMTANGFRSPNGIGSDAATTAANGTRSLKGTGSDTVPINSASGHR